MSPLEILTKVRVADMRRTDDPHGIVREYVAARTAADQVLVKRLVEGA